MQTGIVITNKYGYCVFLNAYYAKKMLIVLTISVPKFSDHTLLTIQSTIKKKSGIFLNVSLWHSVYLLLTLSLSPHQPLACTTWQN